MANQLTRQALYHSVYGDLEENVLEHHGVSGMEWGERNGPPYPLSGANKRHAIKEWMENRKKKKRLKKLQKAAKKARKERKEQQEEEKKQIKKQADIEKYKQKLVKKGDINKIKKNAKLFTNEELAYIAEREQAKASMKTKDEIKKDAQFEIAMKRMGQIAEIGSKAAVLFNAGKAGADMISAFKGAKLKDLEAEEKYMKRIKDEFDTRNRINPDAAVDWFNAEMRNAGRERISRAPQTTQESRNDGSQDDGGNNRQRLRGSRNRQSAGSSRTVNAQQIQAMRNHLNQVRSNSQQTQTGANGRRGMIWRRANQNQHTYNPVNASAFDAAYQNRQNRITNANTQSTSSGRFRLAGRNGYSGTRSNSNEARAQRAVGSNYNVTTSGGGLVQPSRAVYQTRNDGRTFALSGRNRYSGTRSNSVRSTPQYSAGNDWATGFITAGNGAVIPLSTVTVGQASGTNRNYAGMNRSGRPQMSFI